MTNTFIAAPWYMQPVSSVLVVAPTEEPLTLAQAKLRAGLDRGTGDPRDDQMNSFIAATRAKVELDTGLALLTQTRAIPFRADGAASAVPVPLRMQARRLQALTDPSGNPFD